MKTIVKHEHIHVEKPVKKSLVVGVWLAVMVICGIELYQTGLIMNGRFSWFDKVLIHVIAGVLYSAIAIPLLMRDRLRELWPLLWVTVLASLSLLILPVVNIFVDGWLIQKFSYLEFFAGMVYTIFAFVIKVDINKASGAYFPPPMEDQ